MKFNYGNYDIREKNVKINSSLFEQFINTENLKESDTLKEVSDKIADLLKIKKGEVELLIGFRYKRVEE